MKRLFLLLVSFALCGNVLADRVAISPYVSAEIPLDYTLQQTNSQECMYVSSDKKTLFYITVIELSKLPSGYDDVKSFDKNVYHLDSLPCAKKNKSYFWQLNKSFCTHTYTIEDNKGILISDTRIHNDGYIYNTRFIDFSAERSDVFDNYINTLKTSSNSLLNWYCIVDRSKWVWIILVLIVGFISCVFHDKKAPCSYNLLVGLFCAICVGVISVILLFGDWAVIGINMLITFFIGTFCCLTGSYLSLDD